MGCEAAAGAAGGWSTPGCEGRDLGAVADGALGACTDCTHTHTHTHIHKAQAGVTMLYIHGLHYTHYSTIDTHLIPINTCYITLQLFSFS